MSGYCLRAASLVASLCAAAACSGDGADEIERSSARVGVAAPVLRASQGSLGLTYHRNALTRDVLVTMGNDGRPVPRILESWSESADGLVWTFKVRSGVRFHDGTLVTAGLLAPHVRTELTGSSLGALADVSAEGDDVIRISLKEPYAFLFEDLSVISALHTVDRKVIGTGPYEVIEESPDRLLLKAAAGYYRGEPEISQVEVQLFPDQRNAWSALMRDEIDMLYEVSRDALQFVRSESSVTVESFPRAYVYLFGLNRAHPALADARVRQALDRAVDRQNLVDTAMAGEGEPAQGHIWPRHWAYDASAGAIPHDPAGAVRLLTEAGLPVRELKGRMPARLRLKCLVYEPLRELALVLQRQLAEVDVDLQIEMASTGQLIDRISRGDFESFIFEMTSLRGFKFPYLFWHSGTPFLKHGYSGADDVLDQIRHAPNAAELKAAASAFQRRVHEDPPAVFLAWGRTSRAVSTRYQIPSGDEDVYHTIARWKLAPKAVRP